ncbi:MAG: TetR/AcrR family transcriptional regulator [Gammaproteobacteria bacterium]
MTTPPRDPAAESPWKPTGDRARDRSVKREAVIRAAARLFRERGYHRTSLDDLATALNVTKPTLYRYVENKEEILFECFRLGVERILEALRQPPEGARSARERLEALVQGYIGAITSEFGWCMVRAEDQDLGPQMSQAIKQAKSDIDQGIRRLVREGIEEGSFRDHDPKMVAFALAGALNWITHWHREDAALTPSEIATRFFALFDAGLSAPVAPPPT